MNEFHRQIYLSALGVETYMPRFHLPYAPIPVACEIKSVEVALPSSAQPDSLVEQVTPVIQPRIQVNRSSSVAQDISPVGSLVGNIFDVPKVPKAAAQSISAADILSQLASKPVTIDPFNLSIWRPFDGLMIVDSRNTKLALPTELLLNNILRAFFSNQVFKLQEEVLRWPTIENSFAKRSAADARNELQTWLSVQHEIRPIDYLWLMGANAATYLFPEDFSYGENVYQSISLKDSAIKALIVPSLNELLQKPSTKKQLYLALRAYHSENL